MTDESIESLKQKNEELQETAEFYNCMVQVLYEMMSIKPDLDELKLKARKLVKDNHEVHSYHDDNCPPRIVTLNED